MKEVLSRGVSWDPTCMALGEKPRRSANKWWAIHAMFRITQQAFKKNRVYKKALCVECQNPNIRTSKIMEKKPLHWGYSKFYLIREDLVHERCVFWMVKISHQEYSVSSFMLQFLKGRNMNLTKTIVSLFLVYFNMHLFNKILYSNKDFAVVL